MANCCGYLRLVAGSVALFLVPISLAQHASPAAPAQANPAVKVSTVTYHGWPGSFVLSNGVAEVIVVPAVGRVMQFHFAGEDPVFWENPDLYSKTPDASSSKWQNFGGDKSWPAPQSDWPKMIGRGWPPPATFDSTPVQGIPSPNEGLVDLLYPVDPKYGIRARRRIELNSREPMLTITTTYEKVSGDPVKVGIGVITQLKEPERIFMVLPAKSQFREGYVQQQFGPPQDLKIADGLVSMRAGKGAQIGSDADTMLWMNQRYVLRIDSKRVPGAEYGEGGPNSTIYTSEIPPGYVELEPFGPLSIMKVGDTIQQSVIYKLMRRTEKDPAAEAKKLLRK